MLTLVTVIACQPQFSSQPHPTETKHYNSAHSHTQQKQNYNSAHSHIKQNLRWAQWRRQPFGFPNCHHTPAGWQRAHCNMWVLMNKLHSLHATGTNNYPPPPPQLKKLHSFTVSEEKRKKSWASSFLSTAQCHLRSNHTFKILLHQFKTQVSKSKSNWLLHQKPTIHLHKHSNIF